MRIKIIKDYDSVVNDRKYLKGEEHEVELKSFSNSYARYYTGILSVNPEIKGAILDWINKDYCEII